MYGNEHDHIIIKCVKWYGSSVILSGDKSVVDLSVGDAEELLDDMCQTCIYILNLY